LKQPLDDETDCGGALFDPALAAVSCPIERGPVKEGSDADRYRVSTTITATSVAYLVSRPKPSNYPNNNRLVPYERMTWQLTATLLQYKQESDGDVHLIVQDIGPEALPGVWDAVRGTAAARGYDGAWRKLSARVRRLQPWCGDCGHTGSADNPLSGEHLRWPARTLADVEVLCRRCNSARGRRRTS